MSITILGNSNGGTNPSNYYGSPYQIFPTSHLAVAGDVVRIERVNIDNGNSSDDPFYIIENTVDDLATARVSNNLSRLTYINPSYGQWQWFDIPMEYALTAGKFYWFGARKQYIETGYTDVISVETSSLSLSGSSDVGATTSSGKRPQMYIEIINTENIESVAVVAENTANGSLLEGTTGVSLIEWKDCTDILGLVVVDPSGTFTIDRTGDQQFEFRLDGGPWKMYVANDLTKQDV